MSDSEGRLFQVTITRTYVAFLVAEDHDGADLEASGLVDEIVNDYHEPGEEVDVREVRHAPDAEEGASLPYGDLAREHDTRTVKEWYDLTVEARKAEARAARDAAAQVPLAFGVAK